jgi:uncharacterized membrane protein
MSAVKQELPARVGELIDGPWPARRRRTARPKLVELGLLLVIAALVPLREAWVVQAISLALLLTVPGALALRALRVPRSALAAFPVFVPATSLVVLSLSGLAVDLVGDGAGMAQPLRPVPLLVGVQAAGLLLALAGSRAPAEVGVRWSLPSVRVSELWPLLLPAVAALGAGRLTNGHTGAVAIAGVVACMAALAIGLAFADRMSRTHVSVLVFGVALALLWGYSLRSRFVYGYDISSEFHFLDETWRTGSWHTGHRDDAYGAMLSLTVLPSVLHALAGTSTLLLLKAVYPAFTALFAVGVFHLAARYVRPRYAVLAVAIIITQSYFFQQMPALGRQEVALLMFIALIAAVLLEDVSRRVQAGLIVVLATGMVVAHYSTTYLALSLLGLAALGGALWTLARRPTGTVMATFIAFLACLAGAGVWYGAVTHSTQNVSSFTSNLRSKGLDVLPNRAPGQGIVDAYLNGNTVAPLTGKQYESAAVRQNDITRPYVHPLKAADRSVYRPADAHRTTTPEDAAGARLGTLALLASQSLNLVAVLAALALLLLPRISPRMRAVGMLAAATFLALGLLRLSGTAANAYNQERAFVQSMVLLSIGVAFALQWFAGRFRRLGGLTTAAFGAGLLIVLLGTVGLRAQVFGGGATTNLANAGEDYDRFYITPQELAGAKWLNAVSPSNQLRYADSYTQIRIFATGGRTRGLLTDITPRTLDRHAWVLGSESNILRDRGRGSIGRRYSLFRWPGRYLDNNFNRVYTSGGSAVYHR